MPLERLTAAIAARARGWARRRQGIDTLPLRLTRRRVYILPTSFGAIYAVTLFAMLLAAMNYNNSMAFALTFLLASLGIVAMHHCHRNLTGLVVSGLQTDEVFAGENLRLQIGLENPNAIHRYAISVECDVQQATVLRLEPAGRALLPLELATLQRGVLRLERFKISSRFPFGLFRAWSWLNLEAEALVYPRPVGNQLPPASDSSSHGSLAALRRNDEDFKGFRGYRPGDSPRHIAWKALARGAPLLVKEYTGSGQAPQMFDLDQVQVPDLELRLSQLCRWVVTAEREAASFGLLLPGNRIAAASGVAQRRRCLTALARFDARPANETR